MPFTPSHAVIALPFLRSPLLPAAIAIGAMTPDLPLFVRGVGLRYSATHALGNILWTTLLAFALFLLWRVLVRGAVAEVVPTFVRDRLPADWRVPVRAAVAEALGAPTPVRGLPLLGVSLAIGVLSHIAWDALTHEGRWGVQALPVLDQMWGPLTGYKWLQHGSSVLGLVIIGVWALIWLGRRVPEPAGERVLPGWAAVVWITALPVILFVAVVVGYIQRGPFTAAFTPQHLAYAVLPPAAGLWGLLTLALCVAVQMRRSVRVPG